MSDSVNLSPSTPPAINCRSWVNMIHNHWFFLAVPLLLLLLLISFCCKFQYALVICERSVENNTSMPCCCYFTAPFMLAFSVCWRILSKFIKMCKFVRRDWLRAIYLHVWWIHVQHPERLECLFSPARLEQKKTQKKHTHHTMFLIVNIFHVLFIYF